MSRPTSRRRDLVAQLVSRRRMLTVLAASAAVVPTSASALRFFNPCLDATLPESLAAHEIVARAFDGIDPAKVVDSHVHLLGMGGGPNGAWVGKQMLRPTNPLQYARYRFFLNASCVPSDAEPNRAYLDRLLACHRATMPGARLMLLAFDQVHDEDGRPRPETSAFHVSNAYARAVAERHPGELEWAASVHPYRQDAVEALDAAVGGGARAVKWLPNAMGIDPGSPRCDPFYEALARHRIPLLTHGGRERAVRGAGIDAFGNPLRLRRALDHGVRVIIAHCASFGAGVDLDVGPHGPVVPNVDLFARLMDEPRYEPILMGDISALMQSNRTAAALGKVLERTEWHARLLNGSDYPLPGVPALFDLDDLAEHGFLPAPAVPVLERIQDHNPLMFDFVLKRTVGKNGARFAPRVFETARHLDRPVATDG
ncbi:MAG: hypothetical protein OXC25_04235 [Thiotrichales bacterium]|nr:hypothetical protein [Thiotrichales bacterium]